MTPSCPVAHHAGRVALATIALAVGVGLLVPALGASGQVQRLLGFAFDAPPREPRAAVDVAVGNLRLVAAGFVAALTIGLRPQLRPPLDVTLAAVTALNAAALGIASGAYGPQLLEALALHAPLELGAFAVAGGTYLAARQGAVTATAFTVAALAAVVLMLTAAVLETYVQIGYGR